MVYSDSSLGESAQSWPCKPITPDFHRLFPAHLDLQIAIDDLQFLQILSRKAGREWFISLPLSINSSSSCCGFPRPKSWGPLSQRVGEVEILSCFAIPIDANMFFFACRIPGSSGYVKARILHTWKIYKYHQYPLNATEPWRGLSIILSYSSVLWIKWACFGSGSWLFFAFSIGIHCSVIVFLLTPDLWAQQGNPNSTPPALVHPPAHPTQVQMLSSTHLMAKKTKIHNSTREFFVEGLRCTFPKKTNEGDNGIFQYVEIDEDRNILFQRNQKSETTRPGKLR